MAYGVTDVNGGARGGEFLTGNLTYFTVKTTVPCYPTNVLVPIKQALAARNWTSLSASRTIVVVDDNGATVTYDNNDTYTNAYIKQQNLKTLLNVFSTRANPVVVAISASTGTAPNASNAAFPSTVTGVTANNFGSAFSNSAMAIYTVNLVTEKSGQWMVESASAGNNTDGYQFLNILDGVPVTPTTVENTPAGPQDASSPPISATSFEALGSTNRNVVALATGTLPKVA